MGTEPVGPIKQVIARMEQIAAGLPATDGVARFNELYLAVTQAVLRDTGAGNFEDPEFLAELDVTFAGLYFAAVDASEQGGKIPNAWEPLFEHRHAKGVAPLQFAIAGMNAHINHDLPVALVQVMTRHGLEPTDGSPQHHDFLAVNAILARVEEQIKRRFMDKLMQDVDKVLGHADNAAAMWSVERARDAAWTNAQVLYRLRDVPPLRDAYEDQLDRMVELASRGILSARL